MWCVASVQEKRIAVCPLSLMRGCYRSLGVTTLRGGLPSWFTYWMEYQNHVRVFGGVVFSACLRGVGVVFFVLFEALYNWKLVRQNKK